MAAISFHDVCKSFPGVVALDHVSFDIAGASCHAVMGENGAGKSTLGKILAGVHIADAGDTRLDGRRIAPATPLEARHLGIAMVHQELAFCPNLTVAENLCLGSLPSLGGFVDKTKMRARAGAMLGDIQARIDVAAPMESLSTAREQLVQIAAAVGTGARVIIMDEPTSSLSAHEAHHLFELLGRLKERGITVVYISHRMEEIFRLCDFVTVLRDGRHVSTERTSNTSRERIINAMVGREVPRHGVGVNHLSKKLGPELLRVESLASPGKFSGVNFTVHAGEILGFAGLVGAGRSEVAHAIFGLDAGASGRVIAIGDEIEFGSAHAALNAGIGFLPEDRKRLGLVLSMSCQHNVSLASLSAVTRFGFIGRAAESEMAQGYAELLRVKTPSLDAVVSGLSGGNQQKIALAKWLARRCRVLLIDEPTRGVDVGAKAEIHRLLDDLACEGCAILLISSELPELMNLSRRILVLRAGEMVGELNRGEFSQATLMRLMAGVDRLAG